MKVSFKHKIAIAITIIAFAACAEQITEGRHYRFEDLIFQVSLDDWEELDIIGETRSANSDTLNLQTIPAFDEDGEEYELTITTERDTTTYDHETETSGVTRAALTTSITNKEFIGYAYVNGDGVADQLLINGVKRTIASNGTWLPTGTTAYEWPSPTQVINFYGIIPSSYTINTNDKTLSFTQSSATPNNHVDLLVASSEPLNRLKDASHVENGVEVNNPIPMNFKHALTAVRFKANKDLPTMTISEIRLKGFSNSGIYTLPIGDASGSWAPGSTTQDYYTTSPTTTSITSTTNSYLNDGAQTFLMIPQSMSTTKKLVLKVTASGGSTTTKYVTANFGGTAAWKPGTSVTYTLSRKTGSGYYLYSNYYKEDGSQYIQVGARNEGNIYTSITSFYLNNSTERKAQYWKITGWSSNNSTWYTSLSDMKTNQNDAITITGSTYGAGNTTLSRTATSSEYDFYVKKVARPYSYSGAWLTAGTNIAANTHTGTLDLSTYDCLTGTTISQTTANCYLVNGVGSYKFPTVYGNAIQNGSTVSATYSGFYDYAGNKISKAAITVPSGATAKILWIDTDIKDVISSVSYSSNYITFVVTAQTFAGASRVVSGNAVIGLVTSDNKVIWQWLINFTTDSQSNRDLGRNRCGYLTTYSGSNFYLRLQQTSTSNGSVISDSPTSVIRYWYTGSTSDYSAKFRSLNFNWGFPRPLPATGQTPTYPNSSITFTYPVETNSTNSGSYTRWNETTKTIFDPCPRGFRVPKRANINSLTIDLDTPFISGWTCADGTKLSIPDGQSQGVYLSSYAASKTSYFRYYIDGAKTIHTGNVSSAPQGMIHPTSE